MILLRSVNSNLFLQIDDLWYRLINSFGPCHVVLLFPHQNIFSLLDNLLELQSRMVRRAQNNYHLFSIFENGTLNIAVTELKDEGEYACRVHNSINPPLAKSVTILLDGKESRKKRFLFLFNGHAIRTGGVKGQPSRKKNLNLFLRRPLSSRGWG